MSEESKPEASKKGKGKARSGEGEMSNISNISRELVEQLLRANPSLAGEMQGMDSKKIEEVMRGMSLQDISTGMATGGKNQKDMASYKFWNTQPVPKFGEDEPLPDGPLRENDLARVKTVGAELIEGFEWDTVDLTDDQQVREVYELLTHHYVEDSEAMFRFNYSASFLHWALKAPGWIKNWHVGVRVTSTKKLVAFISGIPVTLRVRENTLQCSEINFLCIHKKLRGKRLAPVLIKEVTRRCNLESVWNAIYTVGVVLPKPISTCRYFHRSLDWLKLYETGFSPLPTTSTKAKQVTKYALSANPSTKGLREMEVKDLDAVHDLFTRYMERFDLVPKFTVEEIGHWLLNGGSKYDERIVWAYVVEEEGKITDFFSFYSLESSVLGKKETIRAAYLFYYASETAFSKSPDAKKELKVRLNALIHDALILAKKFNFDVFNALTLLDNTLFLREQKFGAGDGSLHYYLFNWRTSFINGGIDDKKNVDDENGSGVGVVML
ncbi:unnamed protein product [Tuber melanosporum]|jgi:glycylpeptide N-tetradecanoyltransferase|uniref:Glycylpeptide N-tetradecanoyltransferase n=1 Tax=Tuber melanosporum (strain Mel28) TaxID=656061 RepID=D5GLC6_TUBMM|nr:uncharacterized protein GSTUM_00010131001 [Tuber melanosporum]CAZ85319.1 unnamed protein product [Tuber melanosporum]